MDVVLLLSIKYHVVYKEYFQQKESFLSHGKLTNHNISLSKRFQLFDYISLK